MLSIYRASAGSGKTYKLAYEYIRLLLTKKDDEGNTSLNKRPSYGHREILAITFTNKATDEMKRRIVHELAVLAGMEPGWKKKSPYLNDLIKLFGCTEEQLREASAIALKQLLFDFGYFQVSTIDSFFQSILRTFANEAELSGNYELELQRDNATSQGLARMFQSLDNDMTSKDSKRLLEWIRVYLVERINEGKKVNLMNRESMAFHELLDLIIQLSSEEFDLRHDEIMGYLEDPTRIERFKKSLSESLMALKGKTEAKVNAALSTIDSFRPVSAKARVKSNIKSCMRSFLEGKPSTTIDTYMSAAIGGERENIEKFLFTSALVEELRPSDSYLYDSITEAFDMMVRYNRIGSFYKMLLSNTFVLGIISVVFRHIEEYRKENNTFLLGDTNSLLNRIIGKDETPFIYERMSLRLRHFLIDEFQDTSRMQWENLKPLLAHSLADGDDSLIIGDEKQCIYRFRNSDPSLLSTEVMSEFKHLSSDYLGSTASACGKRNDKNWRSLPMVVEFNNRLFDHLSQEYASAEYANVWQDTPKATSEYDASGYVSIANFAKDEDQKARILEQMAEKIRLQIEAGYHAGEIAILVRKNTDGTDIIKFLMNKQKEDESYPQFTIVTDDVVKINSSLAVRWIVSKLRLRLLSPCDEDTLRRKNKNDIVALSGRYDSLVAETHDMNKALKSAIRNSASSDTQEDRIDSPAWTLLNEVRDIALKKMDPELLASDQAYVSAFFDLVLDYSKTGLNDVRSFLKWWDTTGSKASMLFPSNDSALKVMTVHKSKGLEFPCVHIPIFNWKIEDFRGVEWFDLDGIDLPCDPADIPPMMPIRPQKSMLGTPLEGQYSKRVREINIDELNVLYVAFTRAERELCVWNATNNRYNVMGPKLISGIASVFGVDLNNVDEDSSFTIGSPGKAPERKEKDRTATDPKISGETMPGSYRKSTRDIWKGLNFDLADEE